MDDLFDDVKKLLEEDDPSVTVIKSFLPTDEDSDETETVVTAIRELPFWINSVNLSGYSMQDSSAPYTSSRHRAGLGWAAGVLVVIVVFGIVLVGHGPKWPIYVTILTWWAFVIYTMIQIVHQKDAPTSAGL
jgi:hypothetical protein